MTTAEEVDLELQAMNRRLLDAATTARRLAETAIESAGLSDLARDVRNRALDGDVRQLEERLWALANPLGGHVVTLLLIEQRLRAAAGGE